MNQAEIFSLQADEIQALASILEDDFVLDKENAFTVKLHNSLGNEVSLQVTLPEDYPLYSAPLYELSAPWMSRDAKQRLYKEIEAIYKKYLGESVVYMCIEAVKDFIENQTACETSIKESDENSRKESDFSAEDDLRTSLEKISASEAPALPAIEHGQVITDRKSVFQAHLARIHSESEVELIINKLKENSKIASATHNVYAYRISLENGHFCQDYDDDKEAKAGSVLLHLLQVLNLSNILIVVTRWYGGCHLGSLRFRHYSNAARSLISDHGLIKDKIHLDVPFKGKKIPVQIDDLNGAKDISENKVWIVLTHGAGGDLNTPQLAAVTAFLIKSNFVLFRFTCKGLNIKYRVNVFAEMLKFVSESYNPKGIFIGGRSMGARAAVMLTADVVTTDVFKKILGIICLSYPLHPINKTKDLRDGPLIQCKKPLFLLSGTNDEMCKKEILENVLLKLKVAYKIHWLDGYTHSAKSNEDFEEELYITALKALSNWCEHMHNV